MKCKYYASMRTEEQYQQRAGKWKRKKKKSCRTLSRKSSAAGMVETKCSKNGKECRLRRLWYFRSSRPASQLSDDSGRRRDSAWWRLLQIWSSAETTSRRTRCPSAQHQHYTKQCLPSPHWCPRTAGARGNSSAVQRHPKQHPTTPATCLSQHNPGNATQGPATLEQRSVKSMLRQE